MRTKLGISSIEVAKIYLRIKSVHLHSNIFFAWIWYTYMHNHYKWMMVKNGEKSNIYLEKLGMPEGGRITFFSPGKPRKLKIWLQKEELFMKNELNEMAKYVKKSNRISEEYSYFQRIYIFVLQMQISFTFGNSIRIYSVVVFYLL